MDINLIYLIEFILGFVFGICISLFILKKVINKTECGHFNHCKRCSYLPCSDEN